LYLMLINVAEETVSTEVMEQSLTFELTHNRSFQLLNHNKLMLPKKQFQLK